jgi:hypothetical protein
VPRNAASAALIDEWSGDAEHKTYAPYSVLKGFEPDLSLAPRQRARASPAAVAAAGQVAQKADQGGARAMCAMYVRATVQCHECDKVRAVYCKQPLRKLEKLHAGRRAVVLDDAGSDSDGNVCNNADADDGYGSDGMGRGSAARKKISRREVQWLTVMLMARQQLDLLAMQQNLRSRKHKALARTARTQHGDVRSMQQPLAWCRTQQTLTRHSQHPSLMSRRTMQTWMHMQILARMQLLRRIQVQTRCRCTCASAPAHADAPLAKRARPAGKAGRASAHGPGTYVYTEVQAARDSGLYTCSTVLTPAGHALDPAIYCNVALTCVAPVESTL